MTYKDPEMQREFQRKWIKRRRDMFLSDKKCGKCGTTNNLIIWGIKITKRKDKSSHTIWSYTPTKQKEYLSKSEILCRTCKYGGKEFILQRRKTLNRIYAHNKRIQNKKDKREKIKKAFEKHNLDINSVKKLF